MSNQGICKLAIVLIAVALLGLACGACASTPEPTQPPPTEPPTVAPPTPSEPPAEEPPTLCPQVKCLPDCYANNLAPAGGDGTKSDPWRGSAADRKFFEDIECAAQEQGIVPSSLTILTCSANSQTCNGVYYKYDGQWASAQLAEAPPNPYAGTATPAAEPVVEPTPCPPVQCLPNCYANNLAPAGGDGTKSDPWRGSAADRKFFEDIECAAQERGIIPSSLTILTCSPNSQTCNGVYYKYDGQWVSTQLAEAPPNPYVGVDLPFVFVLVGAAVLGFALLGTGIFLRLRARTPGF